MNKVAIYPGTFDPFTNGHLDLVERGLRLFDKIILGIANNPSKKPLFTLEERLALARKSMLHLEGRVEVESFEGLLVDYAATKGVKAVIRGLRAVSDFEFEMQMALMNRKMVNSLETVFLMPSLRYIFLSSTIVKEVASYGGPVEGLVPDVVIAAMSEKFGQKDK